MICEAVTLLGAGGGIEAVEGGRELEQELGVGQGILAGSLGGQVFREQGLDGSHSTGLGAR